MRLLTDSWSTLLKDISELVSIDTSNPPGNESLAASWVAKRVSRFGMTSEITEVVPGRSNCVSTLDFGPGPIIVLSTHLDVVPGVSRQFNAEVRNSRLYGRGVCDAKGVLSVMITAIERICINPKNLAGKIILAAVVDEEVGATGTLHLLEKGLEADLALIGEPTSNKLLNQSRGVVRMGYTFRGRSGHASRPDSGVNAIAGASIVIGNLISLNDGMKLNDSGTCTVTMISGGTAVNVIPSECQIVVDRRILPHESIDEAIAELDTIVESSLLDTQVEWLSHKVGISVESLNTSLESSISKRILTKCDQIQLGLPFSAVTDAPHFSRYKIPAYILGPGSINQAHTDDEWVEIEELLTAADIYEEVIRNILES